VGVFVLAKNEQANIGRCLKCLEDSGWEVTVLDSGSTDRTEEIVKEFGFARFEQYSYVDHCRAYNEITGELGKGYRHVLILDADMIVSRALMAELKTLLALPTQGPHTIEAPIEMCIEGTPLRFGSLYPPKAFVFETGRRYFVSLGHGEALETDISPTRTRHRLRHDDRKGYEAYLASQARYSRSFVARRDAGLLSGRDRLRSSTPLLLFAVPFVSYVLKGGFLSGKAGLIYALDRLIAEAIMYRRSLSGVSND
jgi:glycosyltransferase involved in cell wall biosynthesis